MSPGPVPANKRRLRIYPSGRDNRTSKWVTREIAALDFLTGLRMRNEAAIVAAGGRGGGMGGEGMSAEEADALFLPGGGGRVGSGGDGSGGGTVWGWDLQRGNVGGGAEHGRTQEEEEEAAAKTGAGGFGGEAKVSDAAGGVAGSAPAHNNVDSDDDSENGWLDQPLPSGGELDGSGNSSRPTHQLRTAATAIGRGGGARGAAAGIGSQGGPARVVSGAAGGGGPAPARRLRGREAAHVRVPATLRHSFRSLPGHSAAVVRQWEQGLTRQVRPVGCALMGWRMFFRFPLDPGNILVCVSVCETALLLEAFVPGPCPMGFKCRSRRCRRRRCCRWFVARKTLAERRPPAKGLGATYRLRGSPYAESRNRPQ